MIILREKLASSPSFKFLHKGRDRSRLLAKQIIILAEQIKTVSEQLGVSHQLQVDFVLLDNLRIGAA